MWVNDIANKRLMRDSFVKVEELFSRQSEIDKSSRKQMEEKALIGMDKRMEM